MEHGNKTQNTFKESKNDKQTLIVEHFKKRVLPSRCLSLQKSAFIAC